MSDINSLRKKYNLSKKKNNIEINNMEKKTDESETKTDETKTENNMDKNIYDNNSIENIKKKITDLESVLNEKTTMNETLENNKKNLSDAKIKKMDDIQDVIESVTKVKLINDKIKTQVIQNNKNNQYVKELKEEITKLEVRYNNKLAELNSELTDINFFLENQTTKP